MRSKIREPGRTISAAARVLTDGRASSATVVEIRSNAGAASRCPFAEAAPLVGTKILGLLDATAPLATRRLRLAAVGVKAIVASPSSPVSTYFGSPLAPSALSLSRAFVRA